MKHTTLKIALITVTALSVLANAASAQTLISWDVDGYSEATNVPLPVTDANGTYVDTIASDVSVTSSYNGITGWALSPSPTPTIPAITDGAFEAANWPSTENTSEYVYFTLTATAGYEMTISSLESEVAGSVLTHSPTEGVWAFSTNGGASWTEYPFTLSTSIVGTPTAQVNITPITTTGSVEIAFSAYGGSVATRPVALMQTTDSDQGLSGNDNLIITGSMTALAVPEPSTITLFGLVGIGGVFLLTRRNRLRA